LAHDSTQRHAYEPTAFVDHHFQSGNTSSGHYTATILDDDGVWRLFDDDRVQVAAAPAALSPRGSSTTYTVRYSRVPK
jgi:ubiquitin C-terminal hydrolase